MSKGLFELLSTRSAGGRGGSRPTPGNRFRPAVEDLENRLVLSTARLHHGLAHAVQADFRHALRTELAAPAATPAAAVVPLSITGVALQNGQLVASGLLGNIPFTSPLSLSIPSATSVIPILDLKLNPIHLNLLGLKVDTSPICLAVTAQPLTPLGGLLGGLATSLAGGTPLSSLLNGLSTTDLSTLTTDLTGLLNGALGSLTAPSSVGTPAAAHGGTTNILHLSLGPVDLKLLGLAVHLDNCSNGPVTLDISAQRGPGNLLGNLLSGVAHALDHRLGVTAADALLTRVADDIFALL